MELTLKRVFEINSAQGGKIKNWPLDFYYTLLQTPSDIIGQILIVSCLVTGSTETCSPPGHGNETITFSLPSIKSIFSDSSVKVVLCSSLSACEWYYGGSPLSAPHFAPLSIPSDRTGLPVAASAFFRVSLRLFSTLFFFLRPPSLCQTDVCHLLIGSSQNG